MFQEEVEEKVLGMVWNYVTDEFSFKVKLDSLYLADRLIQLGAKMTKRTLLSQVAHFYDPIGFAAAFIIRAKIGMQELWQIGLDWDEDNNNNNFIRSCILQLIYNTHTHQY